MFDGSHYPINENIEKTSELVKIAHEKGMSIEAEVGSIGGEEDGVVGAGENADPNECKMIADLVLISSQQELEIFTANTPRIGRVLILRLLQISRSLQEIFRLYFMVEQVFLLK